MQKKLWHNESQKGKAMFTQVQKLQLRNEVQRVLHVPGNYTGGILEMAIVIDHCLTKEQVKETVKEIVQTLKQTDQVFRNVRLNVIDWYSDDHFEKNVKGMKANGNPPCNAC